MISWGTHIDIKGQFEYLPDQPCNVCQADQGFDVTVEQKSFRLYGIPFFPTGRDFVSTCRSCGRRKKVKPNTPQRDGNLVDNPGPEIPEELLNYSKVKYFVGPILLGVIAALAVVIMIG